MHTFPYDFDLVTVTKPSHEENNLSDPFQTFTSQTWAAWIHKTCFSPWSYHHGIMVLVSNCAEVPEEMPNWGLCFSHISAGLQSGFPKSWGWTRAPDRTVSLPHHPAKSASTDAFLRQVYVQNLTETLPCYNLLVFQALNCLCPILWSL